MRACTRRVCKLVVQLGRHGLVDAVRKQAQANRRGHRHEEVAAEVEEALHEPPPLAQPLRRGRKLARQAGHVPQARKSTGTALLVLLEPQAREEDHSNRRFAEDSSKSACFH